MDCLRFGLERLALIRNRSVRLLCRGDSTLPHAGSSPAPRLDRVARAHTECPPRNPPVPRTGYASLKSQMTRAAESITFNIVEGCGSSSQKELARFLDISIKPASELDYQLVLARDYGVLPEETLSEETIDIRRMLCGLGAKVLESAQPESKSRMNGQRNDGTRKTRH